MNVEIYDTTLRDGTQRKDISLTCSDKLRIAHRLDDIGIKYIEGGWPGSNPKDVEFFSRARDLPWQNSIITSFGATCRASGGPEDDANIKALIESGTKVCAVFGKTWNLHVTEILHTTLDDNLRIIEQSMRYLKEHGRRVFYDAEHFFDGYKADPVYALETLKASVRGGAEIVILCDTNGGTMPWEVVDSIRAVKAALGNFPIGIHAHNDAECAVANTIMAVQEGCTQVQGCINGYGERCGNANICSVMPNLEIKMGISCLPDGNLAKLHDLSHYVSEIANLPPDEHHAYVGNAAFAHKGGIHVTAMRRNEKSYQHIDPGLVGNVMTVVVSELAGRGNLLHKAEEYGIGVNSTEQVVGILNDIKELESQGFSFEAAEASAVMLLKRQEAGYKSPFELIDFTALVENRRDRGIIAEAMVKICVDGEIQHTAAEGNGPVNALDLALRKALSNHYPKVNSFMLSDYKVRILDGTMGTNANVRVTIDMQDETHSWTTVGANTNIITASWQALADAIEYGIVFPG